MDQSVGGRLRAIRKEKNVTQKELADIIGVSPSTVGMYEQGRREIGIEQIRLICSYFRVSVDYLLTGEEKTPVHPDDMEFQTFAETARDVLVNQQRLSFVDSEGHSREIDYGDISAIINALVTAQQEVDKFNEQ